MSVCALILMVIPAAAVARSEASLGTQLARHLTTLEKDREVLRFFQAHRWLLSDPRFEVEARRQVRIHSQSLARAHQRAKATRVAFARRLQTRQLAAVRAATPRSVICRVFGSYCQEALAVSRCESNLTTDAQNGQYLGLFQMGSSERALYGHGPTAVDQVRAAHRYFVASGRDWSPWSCKPWW